MIADITNNALSAALMIQLVAALGVGGIITELIRRIATRSRVKSLADADAVKVGTHVALSELIESNAETVREIVEAQQEKIDLQREKIEALELTLRHSLDEDSTSQKNLDLTEDNLYLQERIQILNARINELRAELRHE